MIEQSFLLSIGDSFNKYLMKKAQRRVRQQAILAAYATRLADIAA